jgi:hypothetical protein
MRLNCQPGSAGDRMALHRRDDWNLGPPVKAKQPLMRRRQFIDIHGHRLAQIHPRAERRPFGIEQNAPRFHRIGVFYSLRKLAAKGEIQRVSLARPRER